MKSIKGFVPSRQESSFKAESSSKRNLSFDVFEASYLFLVSGSSIPLGDHSLYYSKSDEDQSGNYYCERDLPDGKGTVCLKYALRARASAPHSQDPYLVYNILPVSYVVLPSLFSPSFSLDNPFVSDQQAAERGSAVSLAACPSIVTPAVGGGVVGPIDESKGQFGEKLELGKTGCVSRLPIEHLQGDKIINNPLAVLTPVDLDTATLSLYGEFDSVVLEELDKFRELAKLFDGDLPCSGRFDGWSIRPYGISSKGMSYILCKGDVVVMAGCGSGDKAPNFRIEIGSVSCHDSDLLVLTAGLYGLFGFTLTKELLSRVDVCRDASHDLADYRSHLIDTRNWYWNRKVKSQVYSDGDDFTGFQFGRGNVVMRCYDKGFELLDKGNLKKMDFFQNYFNVDFNETTVWRLEYQLRREYLRSVGVNTLADLLLKKDEIWSYLIQEWVVLSTGKVIRGNGHGSASDTPMHDCWRVYLNDAVPIARCSPERVSSGTDRVFRQGIGCLFSYAMKNVERIDTMNLSDVFEVIKENVEFFLHQQLTLVDWKADDDKNTNKFFRRFMNFINANCHLEPVPF